MPTAASFGVCSLYIAPDVDTIPHEVYLKYIDAVVLTVA
jgi:hypothetical protein